MRTISIIIPVFNEERTIREILLKVGSLNIPGWKKEIIVVDDGSTDKTGRVLSKFSIFNFQFTILKHKKNLGKGAAIQSGLQHAAGDFMIVQDSDLEYNPKDILKLIKEMEKTNSSLVLGSRNKILRGSNYLLHTWGINLTTNLVNFLYGVKFSDVYTCYKLFDLKLIRQMNVSSIGFEWDLEALVKLLKKSAKYAEVEISYSPRSVREGKKIRPWHGVIGLWVIIKHRIL